MKLAEPKWRAEWDRTLAIAYPVYCFMGGDEAPDYYDLHPHREAPTNRDKPLPGTPPKRRRLTAEQAAELLAKKHDQS